MAVERKILAAAVRILAGVIDRKSYVPVLGGVLVVDDGSGLELVGSDLDVTMRVRLPAVLPIDRGEAVVRLIRATDEDREALAELISVVDMARMRYMPCDCGGEVCLRCRLDVALPKVTIFLGELGILCS